jgi:type II pantothenate kinase
MDDRHSRSLAGDRTSGRHILPDGAVGIDAGMTMTKTATATPAGTKFEAHETGRHIDPIGGSMEPLCVGVTGALQARIGRPGALALQEIDAAARGAIALLESEGRSGLGAFVLALLGTGTAFAAVRDGTVAHLGGTAMGGGSFAGIVRRIDSSLSYEAMIAGAERGDRRHVDVMISDIYPAGIGRVGPDLTAAHLAHGQDGSLDDFLAGLLNLHGENIGQIAASRAVGAKISRLVLAGGFAHNNPPLIASITAMAGLFGIAVDVTPSPGFAGAVGAALIAADAPTTVGE